MEDNKINVKKLERKIKIRNFTNKVKEKVHDTYVWLDDNKEYLIVIIPAVMTVVEGGLRLSRSISRNIANKQEQKMKDMYIYDRSLGKYVELKKPLSNSDMKTILDRRENGEKLSNILIDLNLIK